MDKNEMTPKMKATYSDPKKSYHRAIQIFRFRERGQKFLNREIDEKINKKKLKRDEMDLILLEYEKLAQKHGFCYKALGGVPISIFCGLIGLAALGYFAFFPQKVKDAPWLFMCCLLIPPLLGFCIYNIIGRVKAKSRLKTYGTTYNNFQKLSDHYTQKYHSKEVLFFFDDHKKRLYVDYQTNDPLTTMKNKQKPMESSVTMTTSISPAKITELQPQPSKPQESLTEAPKSKETTLHPESIVLKDIDSSSSLPKAPEEPIPCYNIELWKYSYISNQSVDLGPGQAPGEPVLKDSQNNSRLW